MQIGDQVRFLNEVGGGRITGFQGKDIVLIEDADGFDIPMLRSQVVVIETNANNFERKKKETEKPAPRFRYLDDNVDDDPSERPISYQPKPQERKGGELLNICLAFVPENSRELSNTRFEAYLINDSNYYVSAAFANNEGAAWHLRWQGTIEPNTKQYVETFDRSMLNDLERLSVQLIAWKQDKPFMLKPAVGVELRLDMVKFYKLHVFQPSPFFREPALIYDIVRDDRPIRQVFVEAEEVLDAMRGEYGNGDESVNANERPTHNKASDTKAVHENERPERSDAPRSQGRQERPNEPNPPLPDYITTLESLSSAAPVVPQRTREEEREALKAAKRALKAEQKALQAQEMARKAEQQRRERAADEQKRDYLEVDLHIEALLDNIEGLSPSVLLNTQLTEFRIMMDRNIRKKGQRIVFIHGKGDGVLREALIKELTHRYRTCTYEDAPFQRYGHGATMVTIR